eukprot:c9321_g1_i2.p1 GENE.c9321_g1_i2~~c9321_g1_i2.p1  ORF type:complete len:155 (-),score=33.05 c9321_g1_i2:82-546(-)
MRFLQNKQEFDQLLSSSRGQLVVIDFTASWCGPCQSIAPVFEQLSNEFSHVTFVKVDVDANRETAASCQIKAMPTFQFYKDGHMIHSLTGANPSALREAVIKFQGDKWAIAGEGHRLSNAPQSASNASQSASNAQLSEREKRLAAIEARFAKSS